MTKIGKTRYFRFGDVVILWLAMISNKSLINYDAMVFFQSKIAKLWKTNTNKEIKRERNC